MSKVVKKVGKVFKKIVSSKIFKVALVAVAVYFGGAALGMWNSGSAAINGAWTAAGSQASQAAALKAAGGAFQAGSTLQAGGGVLAAGNGGGAVVAGTTGQVAAQSLTPTILGGTSTAAGGSVAGSVGGVAGNAALSAGQGVIAPGAVGSAPTAATAYVPPAPSVPAPNSGIISKMMSGAENTAKWVGEHQMVSAAALNGAAKMLSPSEAEGALAQAKYDRQNEEADRLRREANMGVSGTNFGQTGIERPLTWNSTGQPIFQSGLISRGMGV